MTLNINTATSGFTLFARKFSIDLHGTYYHANLPAEYRPYFRAITAVGAFRFVPLPMCFRNSPAIFQFFRNTEVDAVVNLRLKEAKIEGLVTPYVDDVLGGSDHDIWKVMEITPQRLH